MTYFEAWGSYRQPTWVDAGKGGIIFFNFQDVTDKGDICQMVTQSTIELKKKKILKKTGRAMRSMTHKKNGWNIKTGYWEWENTLIKIILKFKVTWCIFLYLPPKHDHEEDFQYLIVYYKSWKDILKSQYINQYKIRVYLFKIFCTFHKVPCLSWSWILTNISYSFKVEFMQ